MQGSTGPEKCRGIASDASKSNFLGHAWLGKYPKLVSETGFEERANQKDQKAGKEPYPRGLKNARKRVVFATFLKQTGKNTLRRGRNRNAKNARKHTVFAPFSDRGSPAKAPKKRFDRHMGSGSGENEFPEPRNERSVCGRIAKNARKRVFFTRFAKKRLKAS